MIVAGTEAPEGKYPWQVRLYSSMEDKRGFCGGTIIAPQWILTAGHCVSVGPKEIGPHTIQDPAKVVVGYGSNDRTKTKKIAAEKIFVREEFQKNGLAGKGDLALIKLKTPIPNPKVITLADPAADTKFVVEGTKLTATGWGALWSPFDKDVGALMPDLGTDRRDDGQVAVSAEAPRGGDRCHGQRDLQGGVRRHAVYRGPDRDLRHDERHHQGHVPGRQRRPARSFPRPTRRKAITRSAS